MLHEVRKKVKIFSYLIQIIEKTIQIIMEMEVRTIRIASELKEKCPYLRLGIIRAKVKVTKENELLWDEIIEVQKSFSFRFGIEEISQHSVNGQTRDAYRICGKKPGRYRPSAEALMRRVLQGKDLYRINNVVDMINMISIDTGFSIGGYDETKIQGDITLGIGRENEPYEGLGKGVLNIHKLPVFRDDLGAFGSPTSDSKRTSVSNSTQQFLMIFLDFGGHVEIERGMDKAKEAIIEFCGGEALESYMVSE